MVLRWKDYILVEGFCVPQCFVVERLEHTSLLEEVEMLSLEGVQKSTSHVQVGQDTEPSIDKVSLKH